MNPPHANDWPFMLEAARHLLAGRERGDVRAVERGTLSQADANDRLRIARALARQWQHIVERTPFDVADPIDALGACWGEIRATIDAALIGARARASSSPGNAHAANLVTALVALRHHQRPVDDDLERLPLIVELHVMNGTLRARRDRHLREAA